jgi:hypothetical protein
MRLLTLTVLALTAPGWVSFHSERYRYTVTYPSTWHRATTSLTPHLSDPHEILTVGTGRLPPGGPRCAQVPVAALEAVGATGALVTVQERARTDADGGFPPRPKQFQLRPTPSLEIPDCLAPHARPRLTWIAFRDRGRHFYALVALGRRAASRTRAEATRVLDSLRLLPVR